MIHAFATSRLDYHYSLYLKLHVKTMHRLPLGQNDVVPFLCGLDHHKHIRPMLKSFHRLPVSFQYQFMALALILKASDGSHQRPNFNLWLIITAALLCDKTETAGLKHVRSGDKAFSVEEIWLWNKLPEVIRWLQSVTIFRKCFNTFLFETACLPWWYSQFQHCFYSLIPPKPNPPPKNTSPTQDSDPMKGEEPETQWSPLEILLLLWSLHQSRSDTYGNGWQYENLRRMNG